MKMKMFKELTQKEETEFKDWAKLNYKPFEPIKGIWHPIIQAECVKMNETANLTFHYEGGEA
jgi:hypothetical protein